MPQFPFLQPPVVRALIGLFLSECNQWRKWFWSPSQLVLISGILTGALAPDFYQSYSFLLSWGASLALTLPARTHSLRCLIVYCVLFPLLIPLSAPHPLSVLINWGIAPFIGAVLFPLSLVAMILPYFYVLTDYLWWFFVEVLRVLSLVTPPPLSALEVSPWSQWVYLWLLNLVAASIFRRSKCA